MRLIDANLLLYAYHPASEHHDRARAWLEDVLSGDEPVGLAWQTILAFLRLVTNPRAFATPVSMAEAIEVVSAWLALPAVSVPDPGERHWALLQRLLSDAQADGPLVMDAHLAALAIEHGATLCTHDRDFARFPGLRVLYPLAERG